VAQSTNQAITSRFFVPDGLEELKDEIPKVLEVIARTARWVHPDTFRALPVWYPETARGITSYSAAYDRVLLHKKTTEKTEGNILAQKALRNALGATDSNNWTVCHIWGIDDPSFQKTNDIVQDRRYYSCIGNMVWLPTPLKGFTDAVPEIKLALRTCAYYLYRWLPDHGDSEMARQVALIKSGTIPIGYPESWPTAARSTLPLNTAPYSFPVQEKVRKRKEELLALLNSSAHEHFPRDAVREVLAFWNVAL